MTDYTTISKIFEKYPERDIDYLSDTFETSIITLLYLKEKNSLNKNLKERYDRAIKCLELMKRQKDNRWWESLEPEVRSYYQLKNHSCMLLRLNDFIQGLEKLLKRKVDLNEFLSDNSEALLEAEVEDCWEMYNLKTKIFSLVSKILHLKFNFLSWID